MIKMKHFYGEYDTDKKQVYDFIQARKADGTYLSVQYDRDEHKSYAFGTHYTYMFTVLYEAKV